MRHRLLVLALVALLLPCLVLAQDGKLRGKVSDKETGDALIGATVTIEGSTLGAAANTNSFLVDHPLAHCDHCHFLAAVPARGVSA